MNVDTILRTLDRHRVEFLLIGGMNFLLRHKPVLTFDVDVWIRDTVENRRRCHAALDELGAQWGPTEQTWGPVGELAGDWLSRQGLFCLTSPHGAIDVFRSVKGLANWDDCAARALSEQTAGGIPFRGISDEDMVRCQLALGEGDRKTERLRFLEESLQRRGAHGNN